MRKFVLFLLALGIFLNIPAGKELTRDLYQWVDSFTQSLIDSDRNPAYKFKGNSSASTYVPSTPRPIPRAIQPTQRTSSDTTPAFGVNYRGEYSKPQSFGSTKSSSY